jgi:hypothetical protein
MQVYFSHSYRDVEINQYFFSQLRDQEFRLFADQKSPTWCVAKLERYIHGLSAFLSIVPRRRSDDRAITFSPYIGYELNLARRSGVPRLIFIDDEVLSTHRPRLPRDAIPFVRESPASDRFRHGEVIRKFKRQLEERSGYFRERNYRDRSVAVIASEPKFSPAIDDVMDVLRSNAYNPKKISTKQLSNILDEANQIESILDSEFCVFLLDTGVTPAHVALAVAHTHCVPSIRLQYDPTVKKPDAAASGRIHWAERSHLVSAFEEQLRSYRTGFVEALDIGAIREIGTTNRDPRPEELWDLNDGPALINHINYLHPQIEEIVNRVRRKTLGSFVDMDLQVICSLLYNEIKDCHFAYEHERPSSVKGKQAIRTVDQIWNDKAATCLDLACLFASLLRAAGLTSFIAIVTRPDRSHALSGFWQRSAIRWDGPASLAEIRRALKSAELVVFETTGAVEYEGTVGDETRAERREGLRMLDFPAARIAAERMLFSEVRLRHFVEVSSRPS